MQNCAAAQATAASAVLPAWCCPVSYDRGIADAASRIADPAWASSVQWHRHEHRFKETRCKKPANGPSLLICLLLWLDVEYNISLAPKAPSRLDFGAAQQRRRPCATSG